MSNLGRRYNPNNGYLNILVRVGIKYGYLPKNYSLVLNRNTRKDLWRKAYDEAVESGFRFITREQWQNDGTSFTLGTGLAREVMDNNPKVYVSKNFQGFSGRVSVYLRSISPSNPEIIYTFLKIFEVMLRDNIIVNAATKKAIEEATGSDLSEKSKTNSKPTQNTNCKCPQVNGLHGGEIAEPNKVNWGNIAKTVVIGAAAGFGTHKAIEHFNKPTKKGLSGLSTGQRKGFNKIQKITARAKKIREANPRIKWQNAMKKAGKELK